MNKTNFKAAAVAACMAAFVTGCASTATSKAADDQTQQIKQAAQQYIENARIEREYERKLVRVEDGQIYVSPNAIDIKKPLPAVFSQKIVLNEAAAIPLTVALERVSELTGIHAYVAKDVIEYISSFQSTSGGSADSAVAQVGIGPSVQLNHRGTVAQLLDRLAASVQSSWEYNEEDRDIRFYRYKTEVFNIAVIPSEMEMSTAISTSSGTNPNSSAGTTISASSSFKVFETIQADIETLLSEDGEASVSPINGTVVVRDTPSVLREVADYVERTNVDLQREVVAEVTVLSVDMDDEEGYGIDWTAVYSKLDSFNLGFNTLSGIGQNTASLDSTVVNTNSRFNGTNAIISALSTQGQVSRLTSSTIRAMNRQMVPLSVGDVISYVAETGATINDSTVTNTVELDEINVGFSLTMLPNVLQNGKTILMQLGVNISELNSLETITSGTTVVQTPNISSRDFLTRGSVRSGNTMVLSGFERIRNTNDWRSTTPNARNWALGGGKRADQNREVIVILVRPIVVDGATV